MGRGLNLVLKLKEKELLNQKRKVSELSSRLKALKLEEEGIKQKISSLKSHLPTDLQQYALWNSTIKAQLVELERKREEIRRLESSYEEELKALARKRGELNLVEGLIKRRRREEEKRKEVLNERFIYQVLYSSSPN